MSTFSFQALRNLDIKNVYQFTKIYQSTSKHICFDTNAYNGKNLFEKLLALEDFAYIGLKIFYDSITPQDISHKMSQIKNLKTLSFDRTPIQAFGEYLTHLPDLEYLYLSNYRNISLPKSFTALKIKGLCISNADINNLDILLSMTNLEELVLNCKKIPDVLIDNLHQFKNLKVIGLNHAFKKGQFAKAFEPLQALEYINLKFHKLKELPDFITQCKNIYHLKLSNHKTLDWEQYFKILAQLPKIETLDLTGLRLAQIDPNIALMKQVKIIDIRRNEKLKQLPETVKNLQGIEEIRFEHSPNLDYSALFETMGALPKIKSIRLHKFEETQNNVQYRAREDKLPESIGSITQLEELTIDANYRLKRLPKTLAKLKNLQKINLLGCYDLEQLQHHKSDWPKLKFVKLESVAKLDINDLFNHRIDAGQIEELHIDWTVVDACQAFYPAFKNLKTLCITNSLNRDLHTLFEKVEQIPNLDTLILQSVTALHIPKEIAKLSFLKNLEINYQFQKKKNIILFPFEYSALSNVNITSNVEHLFVGTRTYFEKFDKSNLSLHKKQIAFALLNNSLSLIQNTWENPLLTKNFEPQNAVFFVHGTIQGFNKKALSDKLTSYKINLEKKLSSKVNYVVIGNTCKPEFLEEVLGNDAYEIVLADHLKDYFWKQDNLYLMDEGTEDMLENIKNLLSSADTENILLAYQMLEGGGVSGEIVDFLLPIFLFHPLKEVRSEGKKLFKVYASASLQNHVNKNWKNHFRKYQSLEYGLTEFASHPAINTGVFISLFTNIVWEHSTYNKGTLILQNLALKTLPDSLSFLNGLQNLHIINNDEMDWENGLEVLSQLSSLSTLVIKDCSLNHFPEKVLTLSNLKHLDFTLNQIKTLSQDLSQLTSLKSLTLNNNPLCDLGVGLKTLPSLEDLRLSDCKINTLEPICHLETIKGLYLTGNEITEIPESITNLKNINTLALSNNKIKNIHELFGQNTSLTNLNLYNNQITKLPDTFDWSNLKYFNISKNRLKVLPNAFENCTKLEEISASYNYLEEIPESIQHLRYLGRLELNHNKIKKIPIFIKSCNSIHTLVLDDNQIESLPEQFDKFLNITTLVLRNNKISALPDKFPPQFKNSANGFAFLDLRDNPLNENEIEAMQKKNYDKILL